MTPIEVNAPHLWKHLLPIATAETHKYNRGHLAVLGGEHMPGAARLASEAAMRIGAGLCTIMAPESAKIIYLGAAPHVLFRPLDAAETLGAFLGDSRASAAVIGPGAGQDHKPFLKKLMAAALHTGKPMVLDADALTVFHDAPEALLTNLYSACVLTPHEGEFEKLFGRTDGNKALQALAAAKRSGANVLLKGSETVIASPDGLCVINKHSSPYLATAGSGDVLAGLIGGLLAQGMPAFDAVCAATWVHGEAALRLGVGLVAPDIIHEIPAILRTLQQEEGTHIQHGTSH